MRVSPSARGLLIVVILLIGVALVYWPGLTSALTNRASLSAHAYVVDLDFWQRTNRERTVFANARFDLEANLDDVPLTIGDWQGQDVPESNQEVMILLDPEQYIQRLYRNSAGQYLWLSMIGGRSSQPFHAPDICYDADGWQYNLGSQSIPLSDGGDLYGLWLEAKKKLPGDSTFTEHIVYYFYLFPDERRRLADGIVLFKLTTARYGTVEETLALQADFIRQLFTKTV